MPSIWSLLTSNSDISHHGVMIAGLQLYVLVKDAHVASHLKEILLFVGNTTMNLVTVGNHKAKSSFFLHAPAGSFVACRAPPMGLRIDDKALESAGWEAGEGVVIREAHAPFVARALRLMAARCKPRTPHPLISLCFIKWSMSFEIKGRSSRTRHILQLLSLSLSSPFRSFSRCQSSKC